MDLAGSERIDKSGLSFIVFITFKLIPFLFNITIYFFDKSLPLSFLVNHFLGLNNSWPQIFFFLGGVSTYFMVLVPTVSCVVKHYY